MNNPQDIQLLLIPGLGGDRRIAYPQQMLPYRVFFSDLIVMRRRESLAHYAERYWKHVLTEHAIDRSLPLFIGGYSFGTAVAAELTQQIECKGLIIIGGLTNGRELRSFVRYVGLRVARHLPSFVFRVVSPLVRLALRTYSQLSAEDSNLCIDMYHKFSTALFREAYHQLAQWYSPRIDIPTLRIHGAEDQIIRPPKNENVILVATAKHLVNLQARETVNSAVQDFVDRTMRDGSQPIT